MDSFLGEIRIFGFSFAPLDWAMCDGSLLQVQQNPALFSVLGNQYGGIPGSTFCLPDLRSRGALGASQSLRVGAVNGCDTVALSVDQLGPHTHFLQANGAAIASKETAGPGAAGTSLVARLQTGGATPQVLRAYSKSGNGMPDCTMAPTAVGPTGSGMAHDNHQPFLALNFCISLAGEYPVRP